MSDFAADPNPQPLFNIQGHPLAMFICYDIAYAETLRRSLPTAELLTTVTNDAWFRRSIARDQHLQIGAFRALQAGRQLLFSSNDGITAVLQANGQLQKQIPNQTTAVLTTQVQPMTGQTPWSWLGDVPILLVSLLLLIMHMRIIRKNRTTNH